jgi:hypothetical protein
MKPRMILLVMFLSCAYICVGGKRNKIFDEMSKRGIDSISVCYYFSPLTRSNFYITVYRDRASYVLDSVDAKDYRRVNYPARLNGASQNYILTMIDRLYVSKTAKIFVIRKKVVISPEDDGAILDVRIYYKGGRTKNNLIYLGSVYNVKPSVVAGETHLYTRAFRQFVQFLIYVTAEQGPYSFMYDRYIRRKEHQQKDDEIFEFIDLE